MAAFTLHDINESLTAQPSLKWTKSVFHITPLTQSLSSPFPSVFHTSGPSANDPTLATLSGDLPTPFNITTSGHQFLVRWSSDHGTNKRGFRIRYVGEYQSMYPNFILLLISIITLHGILPERQTEGSKSKGQGCKMAPERIFNVTLLKFLRELYAKKRRIWLLKITLASLLTASQAVECTV